MAFPGHRGRIGRRLRLLDPSHAQSHRVIEEIAAVLHRRPTQGTITPDRETWCEADLLSGLGLVWVPWLRLIAGPIVRVNLLIGLPGFLRPEQSEQFCYL